MKRRSFIKGIGAAAGLGALSSPKLFADGLPALLKESSPDAEDRVLVLLYLKGGNDGLNTFIPTDLYDLLKKYRENVLVPENSILSISDTLGLHPSMPEIQKLFDEEKLCVIRDVGYPNSNGSHFRSREIVNTASDYNEYLTTGWLGRTLEGEYPDFPENHPSEEFPDPYILALSGGGSQATQASGANFVTTVNDPGVKNKFDLDPYSTYDLSEGRFGEELQVLRDAMKSTHSLKDTLHDRFMSGPVQEKTGDNLTDALLDVTRLVAGGSKTKIYMVEHKNFDTHGGQVIKGDPTSGQHAELLATLSQALGAFQDSLDKEALGSKVTTLVYTEFGRRVMSNESYGTDHGHACTWFAMGDAVNPEILGKSPELPEVPNKKVNVPFQHDFRNVFYSVLTQWFGIENETANEYFGLENESIQILAKEAEVTSVLPEGKLQVGTPFPNPVWNHSRIPIVLSESAEVRFQIFSPEGRLLQSKELGAMPKGPQEILFRRAGEHSGLVYYKVSTGKEQFTGSLTLQ